MNQMIDLSPYLPAKPVCRTSALKRRHSAASVLLALEAVISVIIGVSVLIGVAALLLML